MDLCSAVIIIVATISVVFGVEGEERYCYVCSGHRCLQNPMDPDLFPGRTKCHDVEDYCVTHIRYLGNNDTTKAYMEKGEPMAPHDYTYQSVTRNCAKIWAGNLCRRDFNFAPHITCISTCQDDFCNCDSRSPPVQMFGKDNKVLYESPKKSTWSANDLNSCRAMAGVPGYEKESEIAVRRATNINNGHMPGAGGRFHRRRNGRRNGAEGVRRASLPFVLTGVFLVLSNSIQMS